MIAVKKKEKTMTNTKKRSRMESTLSDHVTHRIARALGDEILTERNVLIREAVMQCRVALEVL